MVKITEWMDKTLYPDYGANWDNDIFREILKKKMMPNFTCLDYGAGRGNVAQMNFKGAVKIIAGIDPDKEVFENPYLDEAKLLDINTNLIPYGNNTFDMIFSNCVMEHVQQPGDVFKEISRVLKPGGLFLFKTPNKWHYMPLIAQMTPTWFHKYYNRLRGRKSIDTFPTTYKCNSKLLVKKHVKDSGLEVKSILLIEGRPEYLRLSALAYFVGYIYERIVNSMDFLSTCRCVMIVELNKPLAL
jgi:SAM-dependent methyltransferase